jgi:hypothetical protein
VKRKHASFGNDMAPETSLRRFSLAVEDQRSLPNPPMWNGSKRWFRSSNVIDLWNHRSSDDKKRIIDFAWSCWREAHGGMPMWPPP